MKIIPRFLLVFSLLFAIVARQEALAATSKVFVFRGRIQAVDATARTFTLNAEKRTYIFSVTDQTKIARHGVAQGFTDLKRGEDAEVDMKIGSAGKGVALSVNLSSVDAVEQFLFAATTPGGKTLSAQQLKPLILHATFPPGTRTRINWHLKLGVFLLAVRSDGTVEKVEKLQSTGHPGLDGELVRSFMKWRFRPNSVNSVRVPAHYAVTSRFSTPR
ncbi:MAG TPA: TonB family protein [Chthoniobacterales bacterium]